MPGFLCCPVNQTPVLTFSKPVLYQLLGDSQFSVLFCYNGVKHCVLSVEAECSGNLLPSFGQGKSDLDQRWQLSVCAPVFKKYIEKRVSGSNDDDGAIAFFLLRRNQTLTNGRKIWERPETLGDGRWGSVLQQADASLLDYLRLHRGRRDLTGSN